MARTETEITSTWKTLHPPLVSVACITYNHETCIRDALEGFLMQVTDFPFEVIIGEDCSTDGTLHIVEEYRKRYPGIIKLLPSSKNLGIAGNFIRTVNAAKGEYIACCEGDDYWIDRAKLQQQVEFLETHNEFSMTAHRVHVVDNTKHGVRYTLYDTFPKCVFTTEDILAKHCIPTLSLVFRANRLHFPDWYHSCRSLDIAMELILSLSGPGEFFPREMGVYRHHDGGITKRRKNEKEILYKSLYLFRSFDRYSNGRFSLHVRKRMASIHFSYALHRMLDVEFAECGHSLLTAFRLSPHHFIFELIPSLMERLSTYLLHKAGFRHAIHSLLS